MSAPKIWTGQLQANVLQNPGCSIILVCPSTLSNLKAKFHIIWDVKDRVHWQLVDFGGCSVMVLGSISLTGNVCHHWSQSRHWEINLRICNKWQSHISTVWDWTLSSKMTPQRLEFIGEYLQNLGVKMEWPALSPGLKPTEHLWDQLRHARVTNTTTLGLLLCLCMVLPHATEAVW